MTPTYIIFNYTYCIIVHYKKSTFHSNNDTKGPTKNHHPFSLAVFPPEPLSHYFRGCRFLHCRSACWFSVFLPDDLHLLRLFYLPTKMHASSSFLRYNRIPGSSSFDSLVEHIKFCCHLWGFPCRVASLNNEHLIVPGTWSVRVFPSFAAQR